MSRKHDDFDVHGATVKDMVVDLVSNERTRTEILGVDPQLILVIETNSPIPENDFRPADLKVLDSSARKTAIAFSSDPEMTRFLERLAEYREGISGDRKSARYEGFFDSIESVRRYGPDDRLTDRLRSELEGSSAGSQVMVDIECWFPDDPRIVDQWLTDIELATVEGGGSVLDNYVNRAAEVAIVRVSCTAETIWQLAELDMIASIDSLPSPPILAQDVFQLGIEQIPEIPTIPDDAPVVGLIDTGVRSAHPFLAGCIYDAVAIAGLSDGQDRHGHGTAVASLILHGSLEDVLLSGTATTPRCRVLSFRVLDDHGRFPDRTIWPHELEDAIRYCHAHGARVINLSLGDTATPFRGPRPTPVAAVLDSLIRELQLLIVVSAGNESHATYALRCSNPPTDYPAELLDDASLGILDPAPASLAITVGGVVTKEAVLAVGNIPFGIRGWPSPVSRHGPGVNGAIKPEIVAAGGTMEFSHALGVVLNPDLECIVANGSLDPSGRILTTKLGTSFAAPIVARIGASILAEYSLATQNLLRALILQGSKDITHDLLPVTSGVGKSGRMSSQRNLLGYGEAQLTSAIVSGTERVVLYAEDVIEIDGVHIYEIPIPDAFFETQGESAVTVSLAYDPNTRQRRLDYLSSRMKFELVRGLDAENVELLFLESPEDNGSENDAFEEELVNSEGGSSSFQPRRLSDLGATQRPIMDPSTRLRSLGTNQLARKSFRRRLRREDGEHFLLVVQNTNRWAPAGSRQPYAIAITLSHSGAEVDLYTELSLRIEQQTELQVPLEQTVRA
jgi:hypothetical protein